MESIVSDALSQVRARSAMLARAFGAAASGPGNPLGLGTGGGSYGFGYKRNDLTQHVEQYRHFTGWVSASIGPVAKRIARQPIRLAHVKTNPPGKALAPVGTKARHDKPWERGTDPKRAASEIWFKSVLPGAMKTVAASADLIEAHPLLDALEDPNPIMVRWSLMFVTVASLMLTGKAYWWVTARQRDTDNEEDKKTPKIEIWPLPSHWIKPVHTAERLNDHYEVTADGAIEPTPVPAEQIVYFSFQDPSSPLATWSPMQAQSRAVVSDEAIAEAQRRGFANGVFPGVAVIVGRQPGIDGSPGERPVLNREQRAQIITAFKQAYRGVYNADEPLVLDQLIQDVKRVTNTNREMDFRESGQYTKERITQGMGVNPIVMGQVEGANRASSATADDHLCQSTVNPILELMSQVLTAWLNPLMAGPNERLYLFIEEARASDPDSDRADWTAAYDRGACSVNEFRTQVLRLPPRVDGDVCYVDANKVAVDSRLSTEAPDGPRPVRPLAPGGGAPDANRPPPPVPAPDVSGQSSDAKFCPQEAAGILDMIVRIAELGYPPVMALSVLKGMIPKLTARKARQVVDACTSGSELRVDSVSITEVCRILRGVEPLDLGGEFEIPVPDVRQQEPYDCGSAAGYAAALAQACEPGSYADFVSEVKTEPQVGTEPDDLFAYFANKGCDPIHRDNRTIEYLRSEVRKGRVCLTPVQYFGDGDASGGEGGEVQESGHWILVNGFTRDGLKYQCPLDGPGEIGNNEFLSNWYDRDQAGRPFVRFCLSIGKKPQDILGRPRRVLPAHKVTDANGHEHDAMGRFGRGGAGGGHGSAGNEKPPGKPNDKPGPQPHQALSAGGHETGSTGDKPADLDAKAKGVLDKIKTHGAKAVKVAKAVGERLHQLSVQASWHVMTKNLADDLCDTAHDYSKLINAKGTGDWLSAHLGVSGNFAAKVGSMVLSYAYTALKGHIAKRRAAAGKGAVWVTWLEGGRLWSKDEHGEVDSITIREAAVQITQINRAIFSALGCPADQLPKPDEVEAWLLKRHDEALTGDADDTNSND